MSANKRFLCIISSLFFFSFLFFFILLLLLCCSFLCRPPLRSHCVRVIFVTHCVCMIQYCTIKHYCANFFYVDLVNVCVCVLFFWLLVSDVCGSVSVRVCKFVVGQSLRFETKQKADTEIISTWSFVCVIPFRSLSLSICSICPSIPFIFEILLCV